MGGGSDISFLRNLRLPCALLVVVFLASLVVIGSCVAAQLF